MVRFRVKIAHVSDIRDCTGIGYIIYVRLSTSVTYITKEITLDSHKRDVNIYIHGI